MKYHGHSLYYQATVAMVMVVMGDTCVKGSRPYAGYYVGNSD